jgi:hypothetical protein
MNMFNSYGCQLAPFHGLLPFHTSLIMVMNRISRLILLNGMFLKNIRESISQNRFHHFYMILEIYYEAF